MGQTIWANYAPRSAALRRLRATARSEILATPDGDHLRVHWNEGHTSGAPILVLLHGLTGCAHSSQVLGLAEKGLAAGFATVRVDLRNALGETPSTGVGHAGRSEDVATILDHVTARAPGREIGLIGYSLGGNIALKALGEMGDQPRAELTAAVTISVPIDLSAAYESDAIAANPAVSRLATPHGGHAGFWGRRGVDSDRFWAEHRAVEFCRQCMG